ncbi:MAG: permease [Planctomycetota bacterium]
MPLAIDAAQPGALIASLLVILLVPFVYRLSQRWLLIRPALDGFVLTTIGGLVLLEILPHSFAVAGWIALPIALGGLFIPALLEGMRTRIGKQAHRAALLLAITGILVHAFLDGVGLTGTAAMRVAVVLHRVPESLAVWMLLRRWSGVRWSVVGLLLLAGSTLAGYALAGHVPETDGGALLGIYAALVGGSLLHVVVHFTSGHDHGESVPMVASPWSRGMSGIGAIAGIALLTSMLLDPGHAHAGHDHGHGHSLDIFIALATESARVLIFAYLTAGLIQALMPSLPASWLGARRSVWTQAWRGLLFGIPLPICSCGVVPVYASLMRQGAPLAAGITLLVAAPELGFDAIFLSYQLLDPAFTVARVVAALVVALAVGVLTAKLAPWSALTSATPEPAPVDPPTGTILQRAVAGLRVSFGEIVDHTAPWILLGLGIAAVTEPLLDAGWLRTISPLWQVPLFALIGMPMYVCASGATPFAAVLVAGGVSPGAAIAFLLTGPATNITTFGVLARLHGKRTAMVFAILMAATSIACGWLANWVLPVTAAREIEHIHASPMQMICLVLVVLIFARSLLRQGTRGFIAQILAQTTSEDGRETRNDPHHHDHDHPHVVGEPHVHA